VDDGEDRGEDDGEDISSSSLTFSGRNVLGVKPGLNVA